MPALIRREAVHLDELADVGVIALANLLGRDVERLVPADLHPAWVDLHALLRIGALHGRLDAVGVVHVHDGALAARAKGAGVVRAIGVALDVDDHAILHGRDEAAGAAEHAHAAVTVHLTLGAGVGGVADGFCEGLDRLASQRAAESRGSGNSASALDERAPRNLRGVERHFYLLRYTRNNMRD